MSSGLYDLITVAAPSVQKTCDKSAPTCQNNLSISVQLDSLYAILPLRDTGAVYTTFMGGSGAGCAKRIHGQEQGT